VSSRLPARGRGEAILLADDEPLVRALARNALDRQGYRVFLAADGAEAVDIFQRENGNFDLVILDASMPLMSGQQACAAIRNRMPETKVLFASGHPMNEIAPNDPFTSFLHKPYTPSTLAAAVREMLDGVVAAK
jgi:two-component system, cell cycle sensor histidine kinase and response regulator CckA